MVDISELLDALLKVPKKCSHLTISVFSEINLEIEISHRAYFLFNLATCCQSQILSHKVTNLLNI